MEEERETKGEGGGLGCVWVVGWGGWLGVGGREGVEGEGRGRRRRGVRLWAARATGSRHRVGGGSGRDGARNWVLLAVRENEEKREGEKKEKERERAREKMAGVVIGGMTLELERGQATASSAHITPPPHFVWVRGRKGVQLERGGRRDEEGRRGSRGGE